MFMDMLMSWNIFSSFCIQPSGTYGLMQYPLASMQSQATFHNMVSPVNQANTLRAISSEVSTASAPRSFSTAQSGGFIGSPYPTLPGLQYPLAYPTNNRHIGNSHSAGQPVNVMTAPATSSSPSTASGGQIEG